MNTKALRRWYNARDTLLGQNHKRKDYAKGLALARQCEHEEAYWINNLLTPDIALDAEVARSIFEAQGQSDGGRSMYWAIKISTWRLDDLDALIQSAELGYPQALVRMSEKVDSCSISFEMAKTAAQLGEPCAMYLLGTYYMYGMGCEPSVATALGHFFRAADLGHVESRYMLGSGIYYCKISWKRYQVLGKIAGVHDEACRLLLRAAYDEELPLRCIYEIGKALCCHSNQEEGTVFGMACNVQHFGKVCECLALYEFVKSKSKAAIDMWLRAGLPNKDLRLMIGKRIWKDRVCWLCE